MSRKLPNINTYRRRRLYEDLRLSGKEKCERRDDPAAADKKERMSQSDLAARLQVEGVMLERDSISRIESGTRFVADYELFIFAKVFGVEMAELLELQKNP